MGEVNDVNHQKLLNNLEIAIHEHVSGSSFTLKGIEEIYNFFKSESDFWKASKDINSGFINVYVNHYSTAENLINSFRKSYKSLDEQHFKEKWQAVNNHINQQTISQYRLFPSITPYGKFLFDLAQDNIHQADAACFFLSGTKFQLNNFNFFIGYVKAYEFKNQKESSIVKRRNQEKYTLNKIRTDSVQKLQDIAHQFDEQNREFIEWKDSFIKTHDEWQKSREEDLNNFIAQKDEHLKDLERTYTEKLKLEGPVQFWQTRIAKYKRQGIIWVSLLSMAILLTIGLLSFVLYNIPSALNGKIFSGEPQTIKAILILAAIISFGAYLTKTFSKLTFSSFHLQRDAEEREQLTMVYLALVKDEKISQEDRNLVLQALFSRADTGLIAKDSSPSMPGLANILEKIITKRQ